MKSSVLLFILCFSLSLFAQVDIGVGLGNTLSFPRTHLTPGQLTIRVNEYYPTDWKERWMIGAYLRFPISDKIRLEMSLEQRSPAYTVNSSIRGKRGVYIPMRIDVGIERRVYVSMGIAPHLFYREYVRYDGDFTSRRIKKPRVNLAYITGLVYDVNSRYSIQALFSWGNELFEHIEIYTSNGYEKLADVEVRMNHVSLAIRMRLSTKSNND